MTIKTPYLIFLADADTPRAAKTGFGIRDWRPEIATAQLRFPEAKVNLGLPDMTPAQAAEAGARTLVIGTVSNGGYLPDAWHPTLIDAMDAGLDIASGMHMRLVDCPPLVAAAQRTGRTLHDIRHPTQRFATGTGKRRPGQRLLTVGTDCAVGKKYTALAIAKALQARGIKADYRATGQTGLLIAGRGVCVDAIVTDFISGAAEWLSPANDPDHWDVVEGQGALTHPSFAAVTLGLLHGTQPDVFVVCHEAGRTHDRHLGFLLPPIAEVVDMTVRMGRITNPDIRCGGISVNTRNMDEAQARALLADLTGTHGVPATDPIRFGVDTLVEALV